MNTKDEPQDFALIRKQCEKTSLITERVIDDFILAFAARHRDLGKKMIQNFSRFNHILSKFDKSHVELFKSQYITHRVFKNGGLIEKFLRNPALDHFTGEDREYLMQQSEIPWRFSFSEMLNEPAEDFYLMKDIFSGEEYLLFSPSIVRLKATENILLWFNLIGYNGLCWQSYGPIGAFQSFGPEDVFFFATENNPGLEDESEVQKDIENDPLPYIMLLSGAAFPRTFHKKDEIIIMMAEHESGKPDTVRLRNKFISEYNDGVYRFTHKLTGIPPGFAQIYYDEDEEILLFHALTETGFKRLVKDFKTFGYDIPDIPYLRVRPQMVTTTETILKKKIVLNEYEDLFEKDTDPADDEHTKKMNAFLALVIPEINEGREPDIEEAARKTGIAPDTASDLVKIIRDQRTGVKGPPPLKMKKEQNLNERGKSLKSGPKSAELSNLFLAAKLICEMEPWKSLYETDIFGVKMPGSGLTWFISVMGIHGEFTAIAAYKGYYGLFRFNELQEREGSLPDTSLFTIPHLLISFTDREDLDKEDLEAIKKSGVNFRGRGQWPKIEEIIPGFAPAFPEKKTMEDLPVLLDQVASLLISARNNPDILYKEGDKGDYILIRTPYSDKGEIKWKNDYEIPDSEKAKVKYQMTYRQNSSDEVSKLKSSNVTLQTDLVLLPTPVKEKGRKAFFPFMLLLLDKNSGMILGMDLLHPDPDLPSMYESVPQKMLEAILKLGYRPEQTEFRTSLFFDLTKNALRRSGCTPVMVGKMPLMDEAVGSLFNNFMSQNEPPAI